MPLTDRYIKELAAPRVSREIEVIALAGTLREQCAESPLDLEHQAVACIVAGISLIIGDGRTKQLGALTAETFLHNAASELITLTLITDELQGMRR